MASELRVRAALVLLQLKDYFLNKTNPVVHDLIKEQLLLYAPFADHDYRLHTKNVTEAELELVLRNEITSTIQDKKWSGMWQDQALATALNIGIYSVYPAYNEKIRPLFHKLVKPILQIDTTIYILPILWSGYMNNSLFIANHFVPLIQQICFELQSNVVLHRIKNDDESHSYKLKNPIMEKVKQIDITVTEPKLLDMALIKPKQKETFVIQTKRTDKVNTDSKQSDKDKCTLSASKKSAKVQHGYTKQNTGTTYHCLNSLPKHYCNTCDTVICTQTPKKTIVHNNTIYMCSFCLKHVNKANDSPLRKEKIYPGDIPPQLQTLSNIELNMISQIHPYMNIVQLPVGGQYAQRGQSISIPIPVEELNTNLPNVSPDIEPYILVTTAKNHNKHFVNKQKVFDALQWLKK